MMPRPCRADDLGALAELAAGFHASHRAIAPEDYHATFEKVDAALAFGEVAGAEGHLLAVADHGAGLAGYVWGQMLDRPGTPFTPAARFLFLHQIFVAPAWRRAGVASALLNYGADFGRAHGASEVFLDAVLSNDAAIAAFLGRGFRGSAVVMRRPLAKETPPSAGTLAG